MKLEKGEYIYQGYSMHRVFRAGDLVVSDEADFNSLRPGDIICYLPPAASVHIVHRLIARTPKGLVTQGDNNPGRDAYLVTREFDPRRVRGFRRGGGFFPVRNGRSGMIQFHYHRFCFLTLLVARKLWPLAGWLFRPFRPALELVRFKDHDILCVGKTTVAQRKKPDGAWILRPDSWKFFYSSRELEERFPRTGERKDEEA